MIGILLFVFVFFVSSLFSKEFVPEYYIPLVRRIFVEAPKKKCSLFDTIKVQNRFMEERKKLLRTEFYYYFPVCISYNDCNVDRASFKSDDGFYFVLYTRDFLRDKKIKLVLDRRIRNRELWLRFSDEKVFYKYESLSCDLNRLNKYYRIRVSFFISKYYGNSALGVNVSKFSLVIRDEAIYDAMLKKGIYIPFPYKLEFYPKSFFLLFRGNLKYSKFLFRF